MIVHILKNGIIFILFIYVLSVFPLNWLIKQEPPNKRDTNIVYSCSDLCSLTLYVPGFSLFLDICLLEKRVLHKEVWIAKLLGNHLSIQVHKKVKFSWQDNSSLPVKGLIKSGNLVFVDTLFKEFTLCSEISNRLKF